MLRWFGDVERKDSASRTFRRSNKVSLDGVNAVFKTSDIRSMKNR